MPAIGIDHVQFSVPDLTASTEFLQRLGWELEFCEPNFARTERPYFREIGKSMAYLKQGRAAIELIDASDRAGSASWLPVFSGHVPGQQCEEVETPFEKLEVEVQELGTRCLCVDAEAEQVQLEQVVLRSADPESSAAFLESLGFRREAIGDVLQLRFPASIIGMGLTVSIIPGDVASGDFVDDLGLCLIALISKDLEADLAELRAGGFETTDIFNYQINGRSISNLISRGPSGEMIELIQIGRA
ncbi:MAG: catechol 2,3-dioxygenase-like lactoylglutathione lyase family enzyme [Planctomycetota bacterium]